jgi:hypothetical protein
LYAPQAKKLIEVEYLRTGQSWVEISRLSQLFCDEFGLTLPKDFFVDDDDFRVYRTPDPDRLYISLLSLISLSKRSSFLTNNSSAKKTESSSLNPLPLLDAEKQPESFCSDLLPLAKIESCEDLEESLYQILYYLTYKSSINFVDTQTLSSCFYKIYGRPIKAVINELLPGLKFVEFMQCYDRFLVEKTGRAWKASIAKI